MNGSRDLKERVVVRVPGLTAPKENATWSIIYLGEIIPDRASRRLLLRLRVQRNQRFFRIYFRKLHHLSKISKILESEKRI